MRLTPRVYDALFCSQAQTDSKRHVVDVACPPVQACELLVDCRNKLKWTYAYTYFLDDKCDDKALCEQYTAPTPGPSRHFHLHPAAGPISLLPASSPLVTERNSRARARRRRLLPPSLPSLLALGLGHTACPPHVTVCAGTSYEYLQDELQQDVEALSLLMEVPARGLGLVIHRDHRLSSSYTQSSPRVKINTRTTCFMAESLEL